MGLHEGRGSRAVQPKNSPPMSCVQRRETQQLSFLPHADASPVPVRGQVLQSPVGVPLMTDRANCRAGGLCVVAASCPSPHAVHPNPGRCPSVPHLGHVIRLSMAPSSTFRTPEWSAIADENARPRSMRGINRCHGPKGTQPKHSNAGGGESQRAQASGKWKMRHLFRIWLSRNVRL